MSVSRSLKNLIEKDSPRPPDWFSQKSCAAQYAHLIENADTPKRKKRDSVETTGESIVRRLTQERMTELGQVLAHQREEYRQLKTELNLLKSGNLSEEKLQKMCLAIEQEEREQEQKGKTLTAWLSKRQKQEVQSPQTLGFSIQRKSESSESHDIVDPSAEEEEKKNKGGRSPLLTSLLKSPSPTTQIQSQTSSAQVTSPTIASLLGSSPKIPNPQLTQNVSPQLHQLVSSAIANATPERPSAGAPTLSMLLELPANLQRTTLSNLHPHNPAITNLPHQNIDLHIVQMENQRSNAPIIEPPSIAPQNISASEIIDHIDEVIPKDIMADVIDKDEINEIIGDIEELIKEEITNNTPALDPGTTEITESIHLPLPQIVSERLETRNVEEAVSLSDSPESEMAIEEIDSSSSNIAEIIGTVAIEKKVVLQESKEVETKSNEEQSESSLKSNDKSKNEEPKEVEKDETGLPENSEIINETKSEESEEQITDLKENTKELLKEDAKEPSKEDTKNSTKEHTKKTDQEDTKKESQENTLKEVTENAKKETKESTKKDTKEILQVLVDLPKKKIELNPEKENSIKTKIDKDHDEGEGNKNDVDQLELNLAKITGDQDTAPAKALSKPSGITNNPSGTEDAEKSQDISLILEDEEISPSLQEKKKEDEVASTKPAAESTESPASSEEETTTIKENNEEDKNQESSEKNKTESREVAAIETQELKKDDTRDSSDETFNTEVLEVESKDEKEKVIKKETSATEESEGTVKASEEVLNGDDLKEDDIELEVTKEEEEFQEEPSTNEVVEKEIKEEKDDKKNIDLDLTVKKEANDFSENVGDLDEEESTLSKLSGGRAMKTYSKKQAVAADSEPETEGSGEGADYRAWKKAVMLVYNRLATHKYASAFLRPITEDQAPGYHSIIFRPMDLSTIKKNIDNGTIRSTRHFQRDVMLMFQNAIMYNKHDTFVYKMAVTMQEECLQHMQVSKNVTILV